MYFYTVYTHTPLYTRSSKRMHLLINQFFFFLVCLSHVYWSMMFLFSFESPWLVNFSNVRSITFNSIQWHSCMLLEKQDKDSKGFCSGIVSYILVGVPVKARLFKDKPILPPFLGKVSFCIFFLPQPAFTVTVAKVLTGDSPSTGTSEGTCGGSRHLSSAFISIRTFQG